MAIKDYSSTAASNTSISGIGTAGTSPVSNFDNALRQQLADIANWTDNDSIASATTTDLGSVEGMYVTITGTTTITGFGTLKGGFVKFLRFSGALTLTHNATSLILPGGATITTAAGDTATFVSEGSGNWRCLQYTRATRNVNGWEYIPTSAFTAASQLDVTNLSAFKMLRGQLTVATSTATFIGLRVSTDNGSSFVSGASDYANQVFTANGAATGASNITAAFCYLTSYSMASSSYAVINFELVNFNMALALRGHARMYGISNTGPSIASSMTGFNDGLSTARNAIRIFPSAGGNFTGDLVLEGIRG